MPISPDLLRILCCPRTRTPVEPLGPRRVERLNAAIRAGTARYRDGSAVRRPLAEGLVTTDGLTVYRIDDGIPVMLVEQAIPTAPVEGWPSADPAE